MLLIASGVRYVYFVDEISCPTARCSRPSPIAMSSSACSCASTTGRAEHARALLGRAGCVSVEAGVESITPEGRRLSEQALQAVTTDGADGACSSSPSGDVPFVQANLIGTSDDPADVAAWRARLAQHGVWSNEPVPLFPYPGSPEYRLRWGALDDDAWERAHDSST